MATLHTVPGEPEVWLVDGKAYLVYLYDLDFITGEIPLAFSITGTDLQAAFGSGKKIVYDRTLTGAEFDKVGALDFGSSVGLANFTKDPMATWIEDIETEAEVRPWLNDPEVLAITLGAYLEGREVTDAEFEGTEWWQTHNDAQRKWLLLSYSDPATAAQMEQDARIQVRAMLASAGVAAPGADVVQFMSNAFITGDWSSTYLEMQVRKLSDPWAPGRIDSALKELLDGRKMDRTMAQEDRVQELYDMWLGPRFSRLSRATLKEWAGKLRNDPDAEQQLIAQLQEKRLTLFPEYTNPATTYDDIAGLWRPEWMDVLGQAPDETNDDRWYRMLRENDAEKVGNRLRRIGIDRGNQSVMRDALRETQRAFSSTRSPI